MRHLGVIVWLSVTLVLLVSASRIAMGQTVITPSAPEPIPSDSRVITPNTPSVKNRIPSISTYPRIHRNIKHGPSNPIVKTPQRMNPVSPQQQAGSAMEPNRVSVNSQLNLTLNGRGRVVSIPAGIDCGEGNTQCSASFRANTIVRLEATPSVHQSFKGWILSSKSRGQCNGGNKTRTCTFTIGNTDQGAHADFTNQALLTVRFSPESTGQGMLTDEAGRLRCQSPHTCAAAYDLNTLVPIHLTPSGDATFEQWAYVTGNRVEPISSVGNLLNVRLDTDMTVQVLLHSQAYRTESQLNSVGCVKRRGPNALDNEYTCDTMNGYGVCHSLFRHDRVSDCHVSFDASGFRELNLTREPNAELITREANITVHRDERGRSDGIRGVTYRLTFEPPPPLPPDSNSPCRGQAGCNSPCYVQLELKEDAKTGELISLMNKKTSCDNTTEIPITPNRYHGYKAFDMCREQAQLRNLRSWNFDIDSSVSERIGALYWFRRLASQTPHSRHYDTVRLKRTTTVSAPMRIQCRE